MSWFEKIISNDLMYHTLVASIIVAAFYVLSSAMKRLLRWAGKKIFLKTETQLDDQLLEVVLKNVKLLMTIIGLHIAAREIRKGVTPQQLTPAQILDYADAILYVAIVVVLARIALGILRVLIEWYLGQMTESGESHLRMTLGPLTRKIINIVVGMVAIIIVLDHFGINIGSLLVSLGIGSLAVALAAQDTLANMIAGFVIMVDRPFRVGDRVELPTGQVGDVHQIGLRSTRILNFDGNLIIVPNAELVKGRIVNYAYPSDAIRVMLRFELAPGTDPERVRNILVQLAEEHPNVLHDPPPRVVMTALSEASVQFTFVCRSTNYENQMDVEVSLREQAYLAFQREGISFAIPQRIVHTKAIV